MWYILLYNSKFKFAYKFLSPANSAIHHPMLLPQELAYSPSFLRLVQQSADNQALSSTMYNEQWVTPFVTLGTNLDPTLGATVDEILGAKGEEGKLLGDVVDEGEKILLDMLPKLGFVGQDLSLVRSC